jgi:hypothetical protein
MRIASPRQILRGGRGRHLDSELEQLAMHAWDAPQGICLTDPANEDADVRSHRRPACLSRPRLPVPPEPEGASVPAHDGRGGDDLHDLTPPRPARRATPKALGPLGSGVRVSARAVGGPLISRLSELFAGLHVIKRGLTPSDAVRFRGFPMKRFAPQAGLRVQAILHDLLTDGRRPRGRNLLNKRMRDERVAERTPGAVTGL